MSYQASMATVALPVDGLSPAFGAFEGRPASDADLRLGAIVADNEDGSVRDFVASSITKGRFGFVSLYALHISCSHLISSYRKIGRNIREIWYLLAEGKDADHAKMLYDYMNIFLIHATNPGYQFKSSAFL